MNYPYRFRKLNGVPSIADTMSVWSGPSIRGSVHDFDPSKPEPVRQPPPKKPPLPKLNLKRT